ncbi:hypothetical protein [Aeromicrobium sp. Leaf350]|uniref:hypothetical protein n=1 Tax=Aeromicrobium sp. Leaf350 TaxID=2876565 RepID=UPI001E2A54A5|nr:hypothetical protein [Aeromicrobium sp. Leaf350]
MRTPSIPSRPPRRPARRVSRAAVGLLAALALVLAGCSSPDSGIVPEPLVTPLPSDQPTSDTELPAGPEIVTWGGHDQQLAIVVRNQSGLVVRDSGTVIEAIGADGAVLATVKGNENTTCCRVVGLQPGAQYGLFADLEVPVTQVDDVRVTYLEPQTEAPAPEPAPVTTSIVGVTHPAGDTVVRVDVDVFAASSPYLVGQAFLVDQDDRLVGVVSGRFYCFGPDTTRQLDMQLLSPTPLTTRVSRVVVHPVPDGVPPGVSHPCN